VALPRLAVLVDDRDKALNEIAKRRFHFREIIPDS
jgi:hypothetical protein